MLVIHVHACAYSCEHAQQQSCPEESERVSCFGRFEALSVGSEVDANPAAACAQALRPGVHGGKDGVFRATFEDKPLLSDIVFLRAWVALDLPRFYNPVTNLLAPPPAVLRAPKPGRVRAPDPACVMSVQVLHNRPHTLGVVSALPLALRGGAHTVLW